MTAIANALASLAIPRPLTDEDLSHLSQDQLVALGLAQPQQGAPTDFGGAVLPNPGNIQPHYDTDEIPATRLPQGVTLSAPVYRGSGQMDISNPATAEVMPAQIQTIGSKTQGQPVPAQDWFEANAPKQQAQGGDWFDQNAPGQAKTEEEKPGVLETLWNDIKSIPASLAADDPLADPRVSDAEKSRLVQQQEEQAAAINAARTKAHGLPYSLTSTAGEMLGVPVSGMEQSAEEGNPAGVIGHALTAPTVMAATAGIGKGIDALSDMPTSKLTAPVRAAVKAANTGLAKSPKAIGTAAGAAIGTATRIPYMGEIGAVLGSQVGPEILPKLSIPGENLGLPSRVTGGPAYAPRYTPGQAGAMMESVSAGTPQAAPTETPSANRPPTAEEAANNQRFLDAFKKAKDAREAPNAETSIPHDVEAAQQKVFFDKETPDIDVGKKVREANPEPTRAEVRAASAAKVQAAAEDALGVKKPVPGVKLKDQAAAQAASATGLPEGFTPVKSTALRGYRYDPNAQELSVVSNQGTHHIYGDVTPEQAQAFDNAESKGKAWNELRNSPGVTQVAKVINGNRIPIRKVQVNPQTGAPELTDMTELLKKSVEAARAKKAQ